MIKTAELRQKYLDYFKARGHVVIPPAPLVLENDPTTLFTSSGMQPLVPYLLGKSHPLGERLVNSQPSFRAQDIEEVGNNRHTTLFEMLGNWSLGDYFKEEQLSWFYEFLTIELEIPKEKLAVTVFEGNKLIPKDEETASIWKKLGIPEDRIFYYGDTKNWWSRSGTPEQMPLGEPGGPDSEVFFEFTHIEHDHKFGYKCHPNCDCGRFLEIGNSVFMQYKKEADGTLSELPQRNVDFGGGLERITTAVNNNPDVFSGDLFTPIINAIEKSTGKNYGHDENDNRLIRIITDHIRSATMLMANGVIPSNKGQGYLLRRLIRRAEVKMKQLQNNWGAHIDPDITKTVLETYTGVEYLDATDKASAIRKILEQEIVKFSNTFAQGKKLLDQLQAVDEKAVFDLYQSYGFPVEVTIELLGQKGQQVDKAKVEEQIKQHQDTSRSASAGMFTAGLRDK